MKGLSLLTGRIREWNLMGLSLLPSLEIAVVHSGGFNKEVIQILKAFRCDQLLYDEKVQVDGEKNSLSDDRLEMNEKLSISKDQKESSNNNGNLSTYNQNQYEIDKKADISLKQFDSRLQSSLYAIYLTHEPIQSRIHLVIDRQTDEKINDETLKRTKKIIEKLKRNKSIIFINFNTATHKLDSMSEHIEMFGLSFRTKQREIRADQILNYNLPSVKVKRQKHSPHIKIVTETKTNKDSNNPHQQKISNEQKSSNQFSQLVHKKISQRFDLRNQNFSEILVKQIEKKYISLFGVEINKNFMEMKNLHKQILTQINRFNELFVIFEKIKNLEKEQDQLDSQDKNITLLTKQRLLTKYALNSLYKAKQYLVASLNGTYTNLSITQPSSKLSMNLKKATHYYVSQRSLHWQVMEIMNEIWDIQGDSLLKQIDKMPLTYIKERYKMLDYQTIGGFMPAACFSAIFSSPLNKMVEHIMETLEIIEMKIVSEIKCAVEFYFHHTSCCYDFSDSLADQILKISRSFRKQTYKVLKSQIQYISVSSEDFWSLKQVKSSLYAPEQQVYIEIKYIGKNYIKKVFDNIKETIPRLIGQNLLKQIVAFLENDSLTLLTNILHEHPLQIELSHRERQDLYAKKVRQRQIDQLIYYFSLKTSSENNVRNLNERMEKGWNRMFRGKKAIKIQKLEEMDQKKEGFFAWARNLFRGSKKMQRVKRSTSQEKSQNRNKKVDLSINQLEKEPRKIHALSEKNWLVIINTGKQVQQQKVYQSGCHGFPSRFRPSIWLHLACQQYPQNILPKVQSLLDTSFSQQQMLEVNDVYRQIDKDVNRTSPANLFKKGFLKDSLTRVLRAYAIYDPQLRYTQGMNYIVAIILCVLTYYGENQGEYESYKRSKMYFQVMENNCFKIFVFMMQKKWLRKIMLIQRQTMTELCIKLTTYIDQKSPIMSEKIERSGFTIEMIFSPALISALTSADIDFSLQKRVIDFILVNDFSHLYKVIGGFVVSSEGLCEKLQGEMLYYFLKGKLYNEVYKIIEEDGLSKMLQGL